jgi:hypothetical protein
MTRHHRKPKSLGGATDKRTFFCRTKSIRRGAFFSRTLRPNGSPRRSTASTSTPITRSWS